MQQPAFAREAMHYNVTLRRVRITIAALKKQIILHILSVCSVFLPYLPNMQIASFLRPIIVSFVTCPDLPYFSKLSHKRHDFWENITEYKIFYFLYKFCLKHFSF